MSLFAVPWTTRARCGIPRALGVVVVAVALVLLPVGGGAEAASPPYDRGIDRACSAEAKGFDPFVDELSSTHAAAVRCIAHFGVANGRAVAGGYAFEPRSAVTREQMASFIARTVQRVDGIALASGDPDRFPDNEGAHASSISRLAAADIVTGRDDGTFDRTSFVTRAQVASFLARAIEHVTGEELPAGDGTAWDDIPSAHEDNVAKLVAIGVMQGRTSRDFAPTSGLTRQEMATTLARTLDHLAEAGFELTADTPPELAAAADGHHWPSCGTVTSEYGPRGGRSHHGIDVSAPRGTEVRASRAGTVVFAGSDGAYGRTVRIDHGGGQTTVYAHLSSTSVARGASVGAGRKIGGVGATGNATGNHLHFEVRTDGTAENPRRHLTGSPC